MALKSPGNITVTYNSNAITGYINDANLNAVVKALPTTVLTDTGETQIPGLPSWTFDCGGPFGSTLDGYLGPDVITPTMRTLAVVYGGVTYTWTSNAFVSAYKLTGNPDNPIGYTATISVSGVPTRS